MVPENGNGGGGFEDMEPPPGRKLVSRVTGRPDTHSMARALLSLMRENEGRVRIQREGLVAVVERIFREYANDISVNRTEVESVMCAVRRKVGYEDPEEMFEMLAEQI